MCFTNSLNAKPDKVAKAYRLNGNSCPEFEPKAVASGFDYPEWPILTSENSDHFILAKWGLLPSWVQNVQKALKLRGSTLNARVESLFEKPSFRGAIANGQRCIIPSTGFFEWHTIGKKKYPYFISIKESDVFSLAGLWDINESSQKGQQLITFTIITVPANSMMAKIHNSKMRMPAILLGDNVTKWLNPKATELEIKEILTPISEEVMEAHTIKSPKVIGAIFDFEIITQKYEYPELTNQLSIFPD